MPVCPPDIPDFRLRTIDGGRYQFLNALGTGSYGVVYRARERLPGTRQYAFRAIKIVPRGYSKSRRFVQTQEASLHKAVCDHPNVVSLHRVLRDEGFVYFIMDFLPGGDLFNLIHKKRLFPHNVELVKNVFLQILDGVEACHARGVFHRDLKPENILLSSDLTQVCIGDFGLATKRTESVSFNTGSRYFMSPECIDCGDEDYPYDTRRSDIWALGIILFTLVTGHLPWRKATLADARFYDYLDNRNSLVEAFPISKGCDDLIHSILTMVPADSISLPEIRRRVRNLDTFWMSEEEVARSNDVVQYMYREYSPRRRVPGQLRCDSSDESSSSGDTLGSLTSSESSGSLGGSHSNSQPNDDRVGQFPSDIIACAQEGRVLNDNNTLGQPEIQSPSPRRPQGAVPILLQPEPSASSDEFPIRNPGGGERPACVPARFVSPDSSSPPSSSSSGLPITPETHAQDPQDVVVAEMLDGTLESPPGLPVGGLVRVVPKAQIHVESEKQPYSLISGFLRRSLGLSGESSA